MRFQGRQGWTRRAAGAASGLAAAAGLAAAVGAARGEPAPEPRLDAARELVDLLGVEGDLRDLPGETRAALAGSGVPPADRAALEAIVAESFDPERLAEGVARSVAGRWDAEAARAARAWLRTPQARGILARGRAAAASAPCPGATPDVPPPPERLALLRRIAVHTAAPERARRRAALLQVAMLEAANEALPASRRLSPDAIARLERAARRAADGEPGVPAEALRCHHRDITSAALARAAAFFESPAGRWAVESVEGALDEVLRSAARTLARRVVERFAPSPAAPWRSAHAAAGGGPPG